ncbi:Uncharacterized protein HZ326_30821 [Fusarium oxysporum f. sp. albedinis]|nr:Uncharacterized protein HZ326_30821 [Fusarium oxysporum f. sp. albedinis]
MLQVLEHWAQSIRQSRHVLSVESPTKPSVETVVHEQHRVMNTKLQTFQLNVRKNDAVQLSIMNDQDLQQYAVLAIAEPYAQTIDGLVVTAPNSHNNCCWITQGC